MSGTDAAGAQSALTRPALLPAERVVGQGPGQGADGVPALAPRALPALCGGGALGVRGEELALGAAAQALEQGGIFNNQMKLSWFEKLVSRSFQLY